REIRVIGALQKTTLGPTVAFSVDDCAPFSQETQLNSPDGDTVGNIFFSCILNDSGNHTLRTIIIHSPDRPFLLDAIELHGPIDSPDTVDPVTLSISSAEYTQTTPTHDTSATDMRAKTIDTGVILGGINLVLVFRLERKVEQLHSRKAAGQNPTLPRTSSTEPVSSNVVAARQRIALAVILEDDQGSNSSARLERLLPGPRRSIRSDNVVELSSNAATHGTRVRMAATRSPRSNMGSDAATLATYSTQTKVDTKRWVAC
ncbi:hypothetical protein Moror_8038, partial [Moniliophthora roreri MCA 2997]